MANNVKTEDKTYMHRVASKLRNIQSGLVLQVKICVLAPLHGYSILNMDNNNFFTVSSIVTVLYKSELKVMAHGTI